ncbi:MAG: hypothetical protein KatS3mg118_0062 [Paracoccaceae bacterium]|nr:MAG: trigger factor [Alphaproteobacteria bacterium]GIX12103.1 MAG: hypothetical protein KatS3mg118_0062 [Paracoccaceae bacterium]
MDEAAARFLGHWHVDRHIMDFDSGWAGRFEGRAVFSPVPGGLAYEERGTLRLGGLRSEAFRRYLWRFPAPDEVAVHFEDGRFFHRFDPRRPEAAASHYCDPDLYEVTYFFPDPRHWRTEWRVEGPRKDYRLVTHYLRIG